MLIVLGSALAACAGGGESKNDPPDPVDTKPPIVDAPIRVGTSPTAIAVGFGAVWVANNAEGTVTRIDARTREADRRRIRVGRGPQAIAAGAGGVWVATGTGMVIRIDPQTRAVDRAAPPVRIEDPAGVAAGARSVWVTSRSKNSLVRLDPRTSRRIGAPIRVGALPTDVTVSREAVWVANSGDGTVSRIDAENGKADEPIKVARQQVLALTGGEGSIWVAKTDNPLAERIEVVRIDASSGEVDDSPISVPGGIPMRLAAGLGSVWVTDVGNRTPPTPQRPPAVTRIAPSERAIAGAPIRIGKDPAGIAVGEGAVWVTNAGEGTVTPIEPQ